VEIQTQVMSIPSKPVMKQWPCSPPRIGMGAIGVFIHFDLRQKWREQRTFHHWHSTLHLLHMRNKHLLCWAILCMVCAFQHPQPLLLTHFMNMGGVPQTFPDHVYQKIHTKDKLVLSFFISMSGF
jgi:hypothetical protein